MLFLRSYQRCAIVAKQNPPPIFFRLLSQKNKILILKRWYLVVILYIQVHKSCPVIYDTICSFSASKG